MTSRVLVIEDTEENLEVMACLLRASGHTVLLARDGEEGLEAAARERPDLILCDLRMPKVDGFEVAEQIKSDPELRKIPLVAVTALAMVGDRERVLRAGFDGYIPKPIIPEEFPDEVQSYLEQSPPSTGRVSNSGSA